MTDGQPFVDRMNARIHRAERKKANMMSETNEASVQSIVHTHGPWEAVRSLTCGHLRAAHNYQVDPKEEWTDADLKLISAAPEMLEALKLLWTEVAESGNATANDFGWRKAREATLAVLRKVV
jgi:hypothetical protein